MEEIKKESIEEITQQAEVETEQVQEEIAQEVSGETEAAAETPAKKPAEQSFAELRKAKDAEVKRREEAERRAEMAERYAREQEAARFYHQQHQLAQQQQPPEEPEPADTDLVEYGRVKKDIKRVKEEMAQFRNEVATEREEMKLRTKYPDIDEVVTAESMQKLYKEDPDAAIAINDAKSMYTKGLIAYRLIKQSKLEGSPDITPVDDRLEKIAQRNLAKPKSASLVQPQRGVNPLDKANLYTGDFTDELAKELNKQMEESIRAPR